MSGPARRGSLARRTEPAGSLRILAAGALVMLAVAGVPTMFAATGVIGVPLSFALLSFALLAVGCTAMGRPLPYAAPFFVFGGRWLGKEIGRAARAELT